MKSYNLTELEVKAVKKVKAEITTVQEQMQRLQGALSGIAVLIASQQDLSPTESEGLRFNEELTELSVVRSSADDVGPKEVIQ